MNEKGRTHLDLFSGIGGFALASRWAGFQTIGFSEIDPYSCQVLAKNFPGIPNLGDIKNINGKDYPNPKLLTGGFPCQPYSNGGLRKGSDDDRAIWPQMARIISEARPSWIIGENVLGLISLELDKVLDDLERLEYSTEAIIIPACAVDAPHKRDRIWIISHLMGNPSRSRCSESIDQFGFSESDKRCKTLEKQGYKDRATLKEGTTEAQKRGLSAHPNGIRSTTGIPREEERRQRHTEKPFDNSNRLTRGEGFCEWTTEPHFCRVGHGIPNRVDRITGLGNAIVPQIAFELMTMINQIDES